MANLPALYAEAWTAPRISMRRILSLNLSERDRMIMVGVTGILFAIPLTLVMQTMEMPEGPTGTPMQPPSAFLIATVAVGATLLGYFLTAGLIKLFGGAFGGTADFTQCKSAAAWSQFVVGLGNLALLVLSFVLPPAINPIVQMVFSVAAIYVSAAYVAEAHGFQSIGKVVIATFAVILGLGLVFSLLIPGAMLTAPQ